MTTYKGFQIEPETVGYMFKYVFYPISEGRQDDYDGYSEGFKYCGNAGYADSMIDAMDMIEERIMKQYPEYYIVETIVDQAFRMRNLTKFTWLSDAVEFAHRTNGVLKNFEFKSI